MSAKSFIEWTDATWNPVTGCTQVSPGCDHCYALTFAERFRGVPNHHFEQGFDLRLWPQRLDLPLHWKKPRRIFVNSMSDLFHADVPDDFIRRVFDTMVAANWHIYQILTKRSGRLARLGPSLPWPPHIWAGVSIESMDYAWRVDHLRKVPALVRFISAEPLLGPLTDLDLSDIHWVITGGESGHGHRPCERDWVRTIRDRCLDRRIPFFHKQWGGRSHGEGGRELDGRTWDELPDIGVGRKVGTRARSPAQERFFDDLKMWSEIKLRILEKYLTSYCRIRLPTNPLVYYIDAFAGTGSYGTGEDARKDGSPVRLARLAQHIASRGKGGRLVCLNFEIDDGRYEALESTLAPFDRSIVRAFHSPFEHHLDRVMAMMGTAPAVVFLDPFGPKPLAMAALRRLTQRPDTELLLNLNTRSLRRWAGHEDSTSPQSAAKVRLVSEVLGDDPARPTWLREWNRLDDSLRWEEWAAGEYARRLCRSGPELRHSYAYPIRDSGDGSPHYYLVFVTRSDKAMAVMNDLVCTEEEDIVCLTKSGQISFMPKLLDSYGVAAVDGLLDEIVAYGRQHQGCKRGQVINHFACARFGKFKRKHYRQAIDQLEIDGRVVYEGGHNDESRLFFR